MGIMQSLRKRDRHTESVVASTKPAVETTPLMFLVPDAHGIATYQLHKFPSARAAEIFVDVTLRGQPNEGAVIFWAVTWQPTADHHAEPLVLIRDADSPVVYLFSFADLNSCHDFIRHEMTRGLELHQVMVYWAVPARVEADFWGRAAITPPAAPQHAFAAAPLAVAESAPSNPDAYADMTATVLPFATKESEEAPAEVPRYLTEADIAETIREMEEFSAKFEAERAPVIDFPSASKKIRRSKKAITMAKAWANFALALDEALDVYVAQQVRVRLGLNRIMHAIVQAALAAPLVESSNGNRHDHGVAHAWHNASIGLADAATVAIRRRLMQKVWMNTAWTLEEAVYAHRLESKSRVIRGWRFASMACAEAANARIVSEAAIARAWQNAGAAMDETYVAHVKQTQMIEAGSVAVWDILPGELAHAAEAQLDHKRATLAWGNAATAFAAIVKANIKEQKRAIRAWGRIARAIKQALAAQDKHRKAQEKADGAAARAAKLPAPVAEETMLPDDEQIGKWLEKQGISRRDGERAATLPEKTKKPSRWEPREEPFEGFRSPPGRF